MGGFGQGGLGTGGAVSFEGITRPHLAKSPLGPFGDEATAVARQDGADAGATLGEGGWSLWAHVVQGSP